VSAPLSDEDAAALARLRAHVAKRGGDSGADLSAMGARTGCDAWYVAGSTADATLVRVSVSVVAPTPAAAILAAGEALGVAL
jgi:hypothetical protein